MFISGEIDSSILVVPGGHARLENISADGKWIQTEEFHLGGKEIVHKAGESVGNVMQSWRKLRQEAPELFAALIVWQSPTALVDSVIFSWQQKEESARFENLLRLVDSLSTYWSDQVQERKFLQQTVQVSVPPGCTPLGSLQTQASPCQARQPVGKSTTGGGTS